MVLTGMSLIRKVAFIMFCLFLIMGICNTAYATIIHYSISGISYYWPSGLSYEEGGPDQPPSTEIVGDDLAHLPRRTILKANNTKYP